MGCCQSMNEQEMEEMMGNPLDVSRKGPSKLSQIPGLEPAKPAFTIPPEE